MLRFFVRVTRRVIHSRQQSCRLPFRIKHEISLPTYRSISSDFIRILKTDLGCPGRQSTCFLRRRRHTREQTLTFCRAQCRFLFEFQFAHTNHARYARSITHRQLSTLLTTNILATISTIVKYTF